MYNPWYRTGWKSLSSDEKDTQMRELARQLPPGFTYAGLSRFARHGQELETGVFERTRSRFVFVPGDQVTLGWEASLHQMDEATLTELNESAAEFGVDNLEELLGQQMSPVREAEITPLLVECGLNSLGWTQVSAEEAAEYGERSCKRPSPISKNAAATAMSCINPFAWSAGRTVRALITICSTRICSWRSSSKRFIVWVMTC